jgi:hypothetical protein
VLRGRSRRRGRRRTAGGPRAATEAARALDRNRSCAQGGGPGTAFGRSRRAGVGSRDGAGRRGHGAAAIAVARLATVGSIAQVSVEEVSRGQPGPAPAAP